MLWAALVSPAWSQPAKFSHRDALARPSVKCLDCHAATASSSALSGRRNIRFNHKLHLAMGNIAPLLAAAIDKGAYLGPPGDIRRHFNTQNPCGACHRGLEQSEAPSKADLPQMADCLVCHSEIEAPFSCEKCHLNIAVLKPPSHTADYIDFHSSKNAKLDKPSCRICHGVNFRCMGCH